MRNLQHHCIGQLVKPIKIVFTFTENYKFKILSVEASYIHSSQIMRNSYLIDMASKCENMNVINLFHQRTLLSRSHI